MSDYDYQNGYRLWNEFLQKWPASRLATMALEDYTKVGSTDTFTYWLGRKELGRPGYPDAIKFGVYARASSEKEPKHPHTGDYVWHESLGNTAKEAFETVLGYIVQIAALAAAGNCEGIDAFEHQGLQEVIKWKIASLYQNRQQPFMVNVFTREPLIAFTGSDTKQNMAALQRVTLERREKGEGILELWRRVWESWEAQRQKNQTSTSAAVVMERPLEQELLERVQAQTPAFFEQHVVVPLLKAMGYERARPCGQSGDHGVDVVIPQDKLELDCMYVQVKRYAAGNQVGSPDIRNFAGSLARFKANNGLFVTTSSFSKDAREDAKQVDRHIVLIDGEKLASLMVQYGVGCRSGEVDEDFFKGITSSPAT